MGLTLMTDKVPHKTIADMKQIGQLIKVTIVLTFHYQFYTFPMLPWIWNEIQRLLPAKPNFYS
jgi:L-ascorbate metabolism protein UlaG (beta-lactamase superfamily)